MKTNTKRPGKKQFLVELAMYRQGQPRIVEIPVAKLSEARQKNKVEAILDLIFYYGQNDVQIRELPSVSMGDIIRFEGERYLIMALGYKKLGPNEFRLPELKDILNTKPIAL